MVQFLGNSKAKKPAVVETNAGRAVQFLGISKKSMVVEASAGYGCCRYLYYAYALARHDADTRSTTANESFYYVAISRARDGLRIYTDDEAGLPEAMGREGSKSAALEGEARKRPSARPRGWGWVERTTGPPRSTRCPS